MAVIAVTPGVPLQNIAAEIVYSLQELGTAVCITPEVVKAVVSSGALHGGVALAGWWGGWRAHWMTKWLCGDVGVAGAW